MAIHHAPQHGRPLARALGLKSGPPDLGGTVHSIVLDRLDGSDHPAWARALTTLALAPTIGVIAAVTLLGSALARYLRPTSHQRVKASPLTDGLIGFGLSEFLGKHDRAMIQVWKLDTGAGRRVVRIPINPSHAADVRANDRVACWGRAHQDGTFRAYHAINQSTGSQIDPAHVSALVIAGAAFWSFVLVAFVAAIL